MGDKKVSSFIENGICINAENTVLTPKKNEIIFNPHMHMNRFVSCLILVILLNII